jgi:hypothetical protein
MFSNTGMQNCSFIKILMFMMESTAYIIVNECSSGITLFINVVKESTNAVTVTFTDVNVSARNYAIFNN